MEAHRETNQSYQSSCSLSGLSRFMRPKSGSFFGKTPPAEVVVLVSMVLLVLLLVVVVGCCCWWCKKPSILVL